MESANLLPLSYRRKQLVRARLRFWLGITLVVALGMGGFVARESRQCETLNAKVAQATARVEEHRGLMQKTEALRKKIQKFDRQDDITAMILRSKLPLQSMGLIAKHASHAETPVRIKSFHMQTTRQQAAGPQRGTSTASESQLVGERVRLDLRCTTATDAGVSQFVQELRNSHAFDSVELKSVNGQVEQLQELREFQVECLYQAQHVQLIGQPEAERGHRNTVAESERTPVNARSENAGDSLSAHALRNGFKQQ